MKKILIGLFLIGLLLLTTSPALATDITITASPSFLEFGSTPAAWTLNGITGSEKIDENTTYYSNPLGDTTEPSATVADADCYFTWSNNSSVNIEVTVNCGAFTGGDCDMTNGGSGSPGATTYGAYAWYSGCDYDVDKVVIEGSGSDVLYTTSTPGEDKKWGAEITTRTDTWSGSDNSTATMTITAAEA